MLSSSFSRLSLVLKGSSASTRHGLAAIHLSAKRCGEDDFEKKKAIQPILRELLYNWNDPDKRPVVLPYKQYSNGPWEKGENETRYPPPFMEEADKKGRQQELEQPPPFMKQYPVPPPERKQPVFDHVPPFMEEMPESSQHSHKSPSRHPQKTQSRFYHDKPQNQSRVSPQRGMEKGQMQQPPSVHATTWRGMHTNREEPPAFMKETEKQVPRYRPSSARGMQEDLKQPPPFMTETPEQTWSSPPTHDMEEADKKGRQQDLEQPPPFMKECPDPPPERKQPVFDHVPPFMEEMPESSQHSYESPSRHPQKTQRRFYHDESQKQSHVSPQRGMEKGQMQQPPSVHTTTRRGMHTNREEPPAFMKGTEKQAPRYRPSSARGMQEDLKQPPPFMTETPEQTWSSPPTHIMRESGVKAELDKPPAFMREIPKQTEWTSPPSTRVRSHSVPRGGRHPELERPPAFMKERSQCYEMDINAYLWTCLENWNSEVLMTKPQAERGNLVKYPPIQAEPVGKREAAEKEQIEWEQIKREQIERESVQAARDFDVQSYLWGCMEKWNWEELHKPKPKLSKSRYDRKDYNDNHGIDHDTCEDFYFKSISEVFHTKERANSSSKESVTWKNASAVSQNRREILSLTRQVSSTSKSWHALSHKDGHKASPRIQASASSTLLLCNAIHQEVFSSIREASCSANSSVLSKEFCMRS